MWESIGAPRAVIIWSASRATVIDPSRTWATNSLMRLLPRSRAVVSLNLPCSTIWSNRLDSPPGSTATVAFPSAIDLAIGFLLLANLRLQLVQFLGLAHRFQQGIIEKLDKLKSEEIGRAH